MERGIEVKSRGDVKKLCATKTDDDTERQLVHTLAHAIVFIVISGRNIFAPFLLERPSEQSPGRPKL